MNSAERFDELMQAIKDGDAFWLNEDSAVNCCDNILEEGL